MERDRIVAAAVLGALLAACGSTPEPPVPVVGAPADVAALAGRWSGSYASAQTGRSGSISFTLATTRDSAVGDVVMIPRGLGRPLQAWDRAQPGGPTPRSAVLTISFVRVAAGRVSGRLAPYADPETGRELLTAFEGRLRGNTIDGTYKTHARGETDERTGEWNVTRER